MTGSATYKLIMRAIKHLLDRYTIVAIFIRCLYAVRCCKCIASVRKISRCVHRQPSAAKSKSGHGRFVPMRHGWRNRSRVINRFAAARTRTLF